MLPVPTPQFSLPVTEIAEANDWRPAAAMLYLIDCLKEIAEDCGQVANVLAVYAALRPRFGLYLRKARSRLSVLQKN